MARSDGRKFSWWLTELVHREDAIRRARKADQRNAVERVPERVPERGLEREER